MGRGPGGSHGSARKSERDYSFCFGLTTGSDFFSEYRGCRPSQVTKSVRFKSPRNWSGEELRHDPRISDV